MTRHRQFGSLERSTFLPLGGGGWYGADEAREAVVGPPVESAPPDALVADDSGVEEAAEVIGGECVTNSE